MAIGIAHSKTDEFLKTNFTEQNWQVSSEVTIRWEDRIGFGDMVITKGSFRILVEIETDIFRVKNDLWKCMALDSWLWIIAINKHVSQRIHKQLQKLRVREHRPWLAVLTAPAAIKLASQLH